MIQTPYFSYNISEWSINFRLFSNNKYDPNPLSRWPINSNPVQTQTYTVVSHLTTLITHTTYYLPPYPFSVTTQTHTNPCFNLNRITNAKQILIKWCHLLQPKTETINISNLSSQKQSYHNFCSSFVAPLESRSRDEVLKILWRISGRLYTIVFALLLSYVYERTKKRGSYIVDEFFFFLFSCYWTY